jgi:hypothetical protein
LHGELRVGSGGSTLIGVSASTANNWCKDDASAAVEIVSHRAFNKLKACVASFTKKAPFAIINITASTRVWIAGTNFSQFVALSSHAQILLRITRRAKGQVTAGRLRWLKWKCRFGFRTNKPSVASLVHFNVASAYTNRCSKVKRFKVAHFSDTIRIGRTLIINCS